MHLNLPEKLSQESNEEFRRLYLKIYEIDISVDEADEEALRLMRFVYLVLRYQASQR